MGWSGQWIRLGSNAPDDGFTDVSLTAVPAQLAGDVIYVYRVGSDRLFGPSQVISMAFANGSPQNLVWIHDGILWRHGGSNLVPPGGATTKPVTVVPGTDQWLMFARGDDQRVYVASSLGHEGGSFGNFQLLLPAPIQTDRAVCVLKHAKFQLFYCGVDHKVYTRIFQGAPNDPNAGFDESQIPGGVDTDTALAAVAVQRHLAVPTVFVFARNSDQSVLFQTGLGGEVWNESWSEVPGGGKTDCALAATVFQGNIHLFATGTDFDVYSNVLTGGAWSGWQAVPGNARTNVSVSAMTYAAPQGGQDLGLYIVARGLDQKPYYTMFT